MGPCPGQAWRTSGMDVPEQLWRSRPVVDDIVKEILKQYNIQCEVVTLIGSTEVVL